MFLLPSFLKSHLLLNFSNILSLGSTTDSLYNLGKAPSLACYFQFLLHPLAFWLSTSCWITSSPHSSLKMITGRYFVLKAISFPRKCVPFPAIAWGACSSWCRSLRSPTFSRESHMANLWFHNSRNIYEVLLGVLMIFFFSWIKVRSKERCYSISTVLLSEIASRLLTP